MINKKFTFRNSQVIYGVIGEGHPVILLHGFGEDRTIWNDQVAALQPNFRLIIPDLPGTGASPVLEGNPTIEEYAECIKSLLDAEQITRCILLGHSMGGYIALAFAEKYSSYLTAFGLVHSTAFADAEEKKETRRKAIQFIRENGAYSFLKTSTPNLFSEKSKKEIPEKITALIDQGRTFSPEALIQYYQAMILRPDRTHVLSTLTIPCLFILGTEDKAAPMDDVLKQVHLPSTSFIHILSNTAHMSMLEVPQQLNKYITSFCTTALQLSQTPG